MQDTLKTFGLSQRDVYEAERKAEIARRTRIQIREEIDDENMAREMYKLGIDIRPDGKRTNKSFIRHREQSIAKQMMNNYLLQVGVFGASIQSIFKGVTDLATIVGTSLSQKHNTSAQAIELAARDDHYYYDTIAVSVPTAQILDDEVEVIARLVKELEAEKNPAIKARLQMEFDDTIAYFEMRQHPKTGMYVHDYAHIELVERLNNADQKLKLIDSARFFTPLDNVVNLRGVKINPVAAFNDDKVEDVAATKADTRAMLAEAQRIPAPAPRIA